MTYREFLSLEVGRVVECRTHGADQGRLFEIIGIDRDYGCVELQTLDGLGINTYSLNTNKKNDVAISTLK